MEIKRTALVLHSALDMFRLVQDVPSYPQFLSWCVSAVVHEQSAQEQLASLGVSVGGAEQTFTTRNRFVVTGLARSISSLFREITEQPLAERALYVSV